MYKVFEIYGESTDGTYMSAYVSSVIVVAIDKESAIFAAQRDDTLLGEPKDWSVEEIDISTPGVKSHNYTQDY
jgi:hypothetical protein